MSEQQPTTQTAERAAYIEALLKDWPAPTQQQRRTIEALLGNGRAAK